MQPVIKAITEAGKPCPAIIVAMTNDRLIGAGGGLPWHLPGDLRLFKRLTSGGILIMGRKTHASIGRPLPGRHNIVLSRSLQELPGVQVCAGFQAALAVARRHHHPVFVIGGGEVYRQALPLAGELHISWIEGDFNGDCYFPPLELDDWQCLEETDFTGFRYVHYRRRPACSFLET